MRIWSGKWLLGGMLFLSACTVSLPKNQQTQHILPPPSIDCSVKESLNSPFFSIGDWPEKDWWAIFNSPHLNDLICTALGNNPTLQEAKRRIEIAKQESIIARSRLFPLVAFDAEDQETYLSRNGLYRALNPHIPLATTLVDLSIEFSYEFDFWGKNYNFLQAAIGRKNAQLAEFAQVRLILTTALAQTYFALMTNILRKSLYEQLFDIRFKVVQLQQLLQQHALSSSIEPLVLEENLLEAKQWIANIDAEIALNKHQINVLAGRSPDVPLLICEKMTPLEKISIPCNLSLDLLARRPDLMAQIWRADALAHEVGAAIADFYPDVNIAALVGLESISWGTLFQLNSATTYIKPTLYLPIFTAGAIQANVCAKKAAFDAAIDAYNQLLLTSVQEVADLLSLARSIFQRKVEQDQILARARKNYELVVLRRQKGLDNLFSDYSVLENIITKELDDASLLYEQYLAFIQLIKALGGGYWDECVPLRAGE